MLLRFFFLHFSGVRKRVSSRGTARLEELREQHECDAPEREAEFAVDADHGAEGDDPDRTDHESARPLDARRLSERFLWTRISTSRYVSD